MSISYFIHFPVEYDKYRVEYYLSGLIRQPEEPEKKYNKPKKFVGLLVINAHERNNVRENIVHQV
jgi:hypothetical protein